uniref:Ig-like domain-containing protein n=1 Tax=Otus sunia TaxID=257818 RepID=A0A8C8AWB4_9STRI
MLWDTWEMLALLFLRALLRALLSALLPGTGRGARETVLGTLGKATILWIPPELQNLTLRFGAAVWKRDTEDPQRKLVLLKYVDGNYTNYMQNRMRFHKSNFSLEILNTSRQGPRQCLHPSPDTNLFLLPLSLSLEPVSDASIHVLSWALANGSCTVTLNCTAARGDDVFYSWNSWDTSTSGLCSGSGSLLHFSYPLQNTSIACTCTANNSISSQVVTFNFSECSYEQGGKFPVADSALCSLLVLGAVGEFGFVSHPLSHPHGVTITGPGAGPPRVPPHGGSCRALTRGTCDARTLCKGAASLQASLKPQETFLGLYLAPIWPPGGFSLTVAVWR